MSSNTKAITTANVVISDRTDRLYFYRERGGSPGGTLPTLRRFVNLVGQGRIRRNVQQACGWLVLIGASEIGAIFHDGDLITTAIPAWAWKASTYEPAVGLDPFANWEFRVSLEHCTVEYERRMSRQVAAVLRHLFPRRADLRPEDFNTRGG